MIRARMNATVRSRPTRRTGETNGRQWAFDSVELLDADFNKFDATLPDEGGDRTVFELGNVLEMDVDVSASGGRLRVNIVDAVAKSRPQSVPSAAPAPNKAA